MSDRTPLSDFLAPYTFASITALKAFGGLKDGREYRTLGYATAGDGGGGTYRYAAASTATDNAGTVHTPGSGAGRLLLVSDGTVNVLQFGADRTGTLSAVAAIQAAINATLTGSAGFYTGGAVYLPPGTYRMDNTVTVSGVRGLKLTGAGSGATALQWRGAGDRAMFAVLNCRECTFSDVAIQGMGNASQNTGLLYGISQMRTATSGVWSPTANSYERLAFDGQAGGATSGILTCIQSGGQPGYQDQNNDNTTFLKCRFANYRDQGLYLRGSQNYGNTVRDCSFSGAGGNYGIFLGLRAHVNVDGGFCIAHAGADFYFETVNSYQPVCIRRVLSEGAAAFLYCGTQYGGAISVEDVRWTGEAVKSGGKFIELLNANGRLSFTRCVFKELSSQKLRVSWTAHTSTRAPGAVLRFTDCNLVQIASTHPVACPEQDAGIFTDNPPTHWDGNAILSDSNTDAIPWSYARQTLPTGATPSVRLWSEYTVSNGSATTITAFLEGVAGQTITLLFTNGNVTLQHSSTLLLAGAADFTGSDGDVLVLRHDGTRWLEVTRSVN